MQPMNAFGRPDTAVGNAHGDSTMACRAHQRAVGQQGSDRGGPASNDRSIALPDETLVAFAQAGSRIAFEHLIARYQTAITRYLMRRTHDADVAADLVQDTFLDAWRSLDRLTDGRGILRWLYRIARNNLLTERRRRRCSSLDQQLDETNAVPAELHVADGVGDCHDRLVIEQALGNLSLSAQSALSYALQGYSTEEVAGLLGISPEAARQRISRAKRQFRHEYQSQFEDRREVLHD